MKFPRFGKETPRDFQGLENRRTARDPAGADTREKNAAQTKGAYDPHRRGAPLDGAVFERLRRLSYAARLRLYLRERFPLLRHGALIFSYFSANQFLAQAVTRDGGPMMYDAASALNFFMLLCLFFHLRVFDDHKDREADTAAYPNRILTRGVFTYGELWRLGLAAIGAEAVIAAIAGPAAVLTWLVVLGWSILMYKEYFVRDWLRPRVFLYAITHTTIMFGFDLLIWSVTTGRWLWETDGLYVVYALNGVFVAFTFEFARKIRMPEDEHEMVDSYSKRIGPFGAAYLVLAVMSGATLCTAIVGLRLGLPRLFFALLLALLALGSLGVARFRLAPSRRTARLVEVFASLHIVSFDFCLAGFLIAKYGLRLGGGT